MPEMTRQIKINSWDGADESDSLFPSPQSHIPYSHIFFSCPRFRPNLGFARLLWRLVCLSAEAFSLVCAGFFVGFVRGSVQKLYANLCPCECIFKTQLCILVLRNATAVESAVLLLIVLNSWANNLTANSARCQWPETKNPKREPS